MLCYAMLYCIILHATILYAILCYIYCIVYTAGLRALVRRFRVLGLQGFRALGFYCCKAQCYTEGPGNYMYVCMNE